MSGIGSLQLLVLLLLLLIPIVVTVVLKKVYPNRLWVGIVLSLLSGFGPIAQFYQEGGLLYFVALLLIFIMWTGYFGPNLYLLLFINVISAFLMWYRFSKRKQESSGRSP